MDAHARPPIAPKRLLLEIGDRSASVSLTGVGENDASLDDAESPVIFYLGKDDSNDFVCAGEFTSRRHAHIVRQHKDYYLIDSSTNGTYVQTEDEQVSHVHRDKLKLWGAGWICLGEPLHVGQPIHYRQA